MKYLILALPNTKGGWQFFSPQQQHECCAAVNSRRCEFHYDPRLLMNRFAALLCLLAPLAQALPVPDAPSIEARSYVLYDFAAGQVLAARDADLRSDPASLTKILTVYVAFDELKRGRIHLDDQVLVSEKAWRQGKDSSESRMFIEVGKRVVLSDLLHGIIIQSGNDATIAVAEHVAGSEETFAALMNQHAQRIGMKNSHFSNASGVPDAQLYTTALDMALLSRALIRDFPEWYAWFKQREFVFNKIKQPNRNLLLNLDPDADGIKTGHTETAGFCLAASSLRAGRRLISVVMGAKGMQERARDSKALLDYGFLFYETTKLYGAAQPVAMVRAWKAAIEQLPVGTLQPVALALPRGATERLKISHQLDASVVAPISAGQVLGRLSLSLDGKVLRTEPLVALQAVAEGSLFTRVTDSVQMWFE